MLFKNTSNTSNLVAWRGVFQKNELPGLFWKMARQTPVPYCLAVNQIKLYHRINFWEITESQE